MKQFILLFLVALLSIPAAAVTYKDQPPGSKVVEVRRATRATPAEVAAANAKENVRLEIRNIKTSVAQLQKQRAADKSLLKQQSKQLTTLQKVVASLKKTLVAKEREIVVLKAKIKALTVKRLHWIVGSLGLIVLFAGGALATGLLVGSIFRRPAKPQTNVIRVESLVPVKK